MALVVCVGLASCAAGVRASDAQSINASKLFSAPESYNERVVRLHACVNVTMHDVTLLACGADNPQINIESGGGDKAKEAFSQLVDFAHMHMGEEPVELPVMVEGVYRSERVQNEHRHTLYVTDFYPEQRGEGGEAIP